VRYLGNELFRERLRDQSLFVGKSSVCAYSIIYICEVKHEKCVSGALHKGFTTYDVKKPVPAVEVVAREEKVQSSGLSKVFQARKRMGALTCSTR